MSSNENGWGEYSRLVLKELETLASAISDLNSNIQDIQRQITELKVKEDRVLEIISWKERVDEVASPTQLKSALDDINDLKLFKTKAITVFAVVQFLMAAALFLQKFME